MQRVQGEKPIYVDADPVGGTISLEVLAGDTSWIVRISAVQSEHLRTLLQKAELVVETGVGEMKDP